VSAPPQGAGRVLPSGCGPWARLLLPEVLGRLCTHVAGVAVFGTARWQLTPRRCGGSMEALCTHGAGVCVSQGALNTSCWRGQHAARDVPRPERHTHYFVD
jgi:hypothetical protein